MKENAHKVKLVKVQQIMQLVQDSDGVPVGLLDIIQTVNPMD